MSTASLCFVCSGALRKEFSKDSFTYFQCSRCRHVITYPIPTDKDLREHYTKGFKEGNYSVVQRYPDIYSSLMLDLSLAVTKILKQRGIFMQGLSVLDIGCFNGEFLAHIKTRGARVWGVELQEDAVRLANRRLPGKIVKGDVLDPGLTLPAHDFDLITLLGVIEHVRDPYSLLKRAKSLLKTGGTVILQTPNTSSLSAKICKKYWPAYTPLEHINLFSVKSIRTVLVNLGFTDIRHMRHIKRMSLGYAYGMLKTFSPGLSVWVKRLIQILPQGFQRVYVPVYQGEMIVCASKKG